MEKSAFLAAVRLNKLILLYKPLLAGADPGFKKRVARLRSLTEQLVAQAMLGTAPKASETVLKLLFEAAKTSLEEQLHVEVLLEQHADRMPRRKNLLKPMGRVWRPAFLLERVEVVLAGASKMFIDDGVDPLVGEPLDNNERGKLLRQFGSIVRNADWLPLLLDLGVPAPTAVKLNQKLESSYSSHPGRQQLEALIERFCPASSAEAKKTVRKARKVTCNPDATGLYTLSIQLDAQALSDNTEFARLAGLTLPKSGEPREHLLSELLAYALAPVRVPDLADMPAIAEQRVTELFDRLLLREQAIKLAKAKEAKEHAKAQKVRIMEELRQLDPKLLKALRSDPGLLDLL